MGAAVVAERSPRRRAEVIDGDGGGHGDAAARAGLSRFHPAGLVGVGVDHGLVGGEGWAERGHDALGLVDDDDEEAESEDVDEESDWEVDGGLTKLLAQCGDPRKYGNCQE